MFSYYGSKSKIAKYYPKPKYDIIVEPFAGSAQYSKLYRDRNIILNEKYDVLYNIWNWLINEATVEDLQKYTEFNKGDNIRNLDLHPSHLALLGFFVDSGCESPKFTVTKWAANRITNRINRLINILPEIKHWKIYFGDYRKLPNIEATWFIDPPYQHGGKRYKIHDINYEELAEWCETRNGQVIVCENSKANWMNFTPLKKLHGQKYTTMECMWVNDQSI